MDRVERQKSLELIASRVGKTVCLATEILAPHEPLRIHLRKEVIELLSNVIACESGESLSVINNERAIRGSISQLVAGISLLKDSHVINEATYKVLDDDLEQLRKELKVREGTNLNMSNVSASSASGTGREPWEKGLLQKKSFPAVSQGNNDRRRRILDLLVSLGPASVSDLAPHIEGCSDKTIQRELVGMVRDALLKKTGERRWSRYSVMS